MSQNGNDADDRRSSVRVVGIGGGGCSAVNRMIADGIPADFIAVDTNTATLMQSQAKVRVRLGDALVQGQGTGGSAELGREAAEASEDELYEVLRLSDLVFVVAGMGGGTGTGAAPLVARVAKASGALTIGLVLMPFSVEGSKRKLLADASLITLRHEADAVITIAGDTLFSMTEDPVSELELYTEVNSAFAQIVHGIVDLLVLPAQIELDVKDLRYIIGGSRNLAVSVGAANAPDASTRVAEMVVQSPLMAQPLHSARRILFNITGGPNLSLFQVNEVAALIKDHSDKNAEMIFGCRVDESLDDEIRVILVASDFA